MPLKPTDREVHENQDGLLNLYFDSITCITNNMIKVKICGSIVTIKIKICGSIMTIKIRVWVQL
jgi:hypothetical protein